MEIPGTVHVLVFRSRIWRGISFEAVHSFEGVSGWLGFVLSVVGGLL